LTESNKYALAPALLLGGTAIPFVEEIAANTGRRYDDVLKTLREAPYRVPGERVVTADAKSFIEKRAALQQEKTAQGALKAITGIGSLFGKVVPKNMSTGAALGGAAGLAGLGILAGPTLDALGEKVKDRLVPTNMQDQMLDEGASSFAKAVGSQTGQSTVGLLGDIMSKAVSGVTALPRALARSNMFEQLQQEDDVLAQADPQSLQEAYHTMVRFAPTLATDKNAVRSFLRESVLYGTGPNVITIKQLADAERASTGE
jgi:hypothetical protein